MKRLSLMTTLVTLLVLLSSCSLGLNRENIDFGIDPNPLGFNYTINPTTGVVTFIIPSHTLRLSNKAGAIGATVQGYSLEFYDSSGNPLFPGDHVVNSQGSLNVYVPAGLICDEPDPERGCHFISPGARYARSPVAVSQTGYFMPITIAFADYQLLFSGGAVGAYADAYLYGVNDNLSAFRSGPYQVAIQVPVGE